jgi:hypothetical protein
LEDSARIESVNEPAIGPSLPPTADEELPEMESEPFDTQSSYADIRATIRGLTMPPFPNFNIPPSPPGSPPLAATKKVANFLELKKKGVHFNSKLESSAALKNPGLLQKLMEFAGINDYDQYATPYPDDLAVPTAFPPWAYGDQLNKTQQALLKEKENQKRTQTRDKIDFVPASTAASSGIKPGKGGDSSRSRAQYSDHGSSSRSRRI